MQKKELKLEVKTANTPVTRDLTCSKHSSFFCLQRLTLCWETSFSSKYFNLSTLHCILTSCPTLRPSEGRGRKPTAMHGSRTGLCKVIAVLKINSCLTPSTPVDSFKKGRWAPDVLSPEIPYLIFNMLSGCFVASSASCF